MRSAVHYCVHSVRIIVHNSSATQLVETYMIRFGYSGMVLRVRELQYNETRKFLYQCVQTDMLTMLNMNMPTHPKLPCIHAD